MSFLYLGVIPFSSTKMIHSFSQKILFLEDRLVNLCTLTLRRFTDSFILNTSRHVFSSYSSTTTTVLVDIMLAITIIKKFSYCYALSVCYHAIDHLAFLKGDHGSMSSLKIASYAEKVLLY